MSRHEVWELCPAERAGGSQQPAGQSISWGGRRASQHRFPARLNAAACWALYRALQDIFEALQVLCAAVWLSPLYPMYLQQATGFSLLAVVLGIMLPRSGQKASGRVPGPDLVSQTPHTFHKWVWCSREPLLQVRGKPFLVPGNTSSRVSQQLWGVPAAERSCAQGSGGWSSQHQVSANKA